MRIKDCQREITWEIAVQDVFEHHKDVPFYHASTLAFLGADRVAIACFAGSFEGKDDVRIVLTQQDDKGEFSAPIRFGGEEDAPCWNPVLHRGGSGQDDDQLELYFKHGRTIADWITLRSTYGRIYRSDSADYGRTWCAPYETEMVNNNSGIDMVKLKDRLFLVCNPVENGDISSPRSPLSIFVSEDNGVCFELFHVLECEPGAYAYPAIITDGENLHVTYTWNNKTIKYVKLTCKGET